MVEIDIITYKGKKYLLNFYEMTFEKVTNSQFQTYRILLKDETLAKQLPKLNAKFEAMARKHNKQYGNSNQNPK